VLVDTWVKAFPWHAFDLDVGSILAGVLLRMLLMFAFITPFQGCVKSIVAEKELRLREGMALLGLRAQAYWSSWFLTHFSTVRKNWAEWEWEQSYIVTRRRAPSPARRPSSLMEGEREGAWRARAGRYPSHQRRVSLCLFRSVCGRGRGQL
jgi:hypothetical protein